MYCIVPVHVIVLHFSQSSSQGTYPLHHRCLSCSPACSPYVGDYHFFKTPTACQEKQSVLWKDCQTFVLPSLEQHPSLLAPAASPWLLHHCIHYCMAYFLMCTRSSTGYCIVCDLWKWTWFWSRDTDLLLLLQLIMSIYRCTVGVFKPDFQCKMVTFICHFKIYSRFLWWLLIL